jgi:hypothetical protein
MKGEIDTSFMTSQRDLFLGGMAAQIGMNAYGVWMAIKSHANYNTGECWPGMRLLSELTSLSLGAVQKSVQTLLDARLLRLQEEGKGKRSAKYVARERLDVRVGSRVLCTIVIDYVPNKLRERINNLAKAISEGRDDPEFANVEIIPGPGFSWDNESQVLRAVIPASELPNAIADSEDAEQIGNELQKKVQAMKSASKSRRIKAPNSV